MNARFAATNALLAIEGGYAITGHGASVPAMPTATRTLSGIWFALIDMMAITIAPKLEAIHASAGRVRSRTAASPKRRAASTQPRPS